VIEPLNIGRLSSLKKLTRLTIDSHGTDALNAKDLEDISRLSSLEDLNVQFLDGGLEHLTKLAKIRRLTLAGRNVGHDIWRMLKGFKSITDLNLSSYPLDTGAGFATIKDCMNLRSLNVSAIGSKGLSALSALPQLEDLG